METRVPRMYEKLSTFLFKVAPGGGGKRGKGAYVPGLARWVACRLYRVGKPPSSITPYHLLLSPPLLPRNRSPSKLSVPDSSLRFIGAAYPSAQVYLWTSEARVWLDMELEEGRCCWRRRGGEMGGRGAGG